MGPFEETGFDAFDVKSVTTAAVVTVDDDNNSAKPPAGDDKKDNTVIIAAAAARQRIPTLSRKRAIRRRLPTAAWQRRTCHVTVKSLTATALSRSKELLKLPRTSCRTF